MAGVIHGGRLDKAVAEFGGERETWIDLSTGINPFAYPHCEISRSTLERLPDETAERKLASAARRFYELPENAGLVASPGTQALIQLLPRLGIGGRVAIAGPTYGEYAHVWQESGALVEMFDGSGPVPGGADVAVFVNPNNPTGSAVDRSHLIEQARNVSLLLIDEAFGGPQSDLLNEAQVELPKNVVVLKSFGKFFGLAGLRLGFAVCMPTLADKFRALLGPWAVSGTAIEIGTRALCDLQWSGDMRERLRQQADEQAALLEAGGLAVAGRGGDLFLYARCDDTHQLYRQLANHRILVRHFPDDRAHLRFGLCRDAAEMRRLEEALRDA